MNLLVTGSGGLVGSEAVLYFCKQGWTVYGIDNDTRHALFGSAASVRERINELKKNSLYHHLEVNIVDQRLTEDAVKLANPDAVIHAAAQPSHDWAVKRPHFDFQVNALGTLNLLEAVRHLSNAIPFVYTSTNKVYGDTPNHLPLLEEDTRWSLPSFHRWAKGIDETMSIDASTHSLFGVSKLSGDLMVQEYGRYFGMPTVAFRCGCITGPAHRGVELHGFLSYLVKCAVAGTSYRIFGHKGKQVRDNIHAYDLVKAFEQYILAPTSGRVYNMGGGMENSVSMQEAISMVQGITGRKLNYEYVDQERIGDHRWWVSSMDKFKLDYNWSVTYSLKNMLEELHENA